MEKPSAHGDQHPQDRFRLVAAQRQRAVAQGARHGLQRVIGQR